MGNVLSSVFRGCGRHGSKAGTGPIDVALWAEQPHPVDLSWVDGLVASIKPHVVIRPEDDLLIQVPNSPHKMNGTAIRILRAMLEDGLDIRQILDREGDSPRKRRELHYFFTDLADLLRGTLGEGEGRRAVVREPFDADYSVYPVLSEVALTYRCNASCVFCYAGCRQSGLPPGWDEDRTMTDEQVMRVLEVIRRDARCPSVSFTGGEPTLRPGLPALVSCARSLGLKVNLITNGLALTETLVDALAEAGLDSAQLSLEGPTAAIHDAQVGRRGAFDRLWEGVERLRAKAIEVHTNTTITRRNIECLPAIIDLVASKGLDRLTMNLVIPGGALTPKIRLPSPTTVGEGHGGEGSTSQMGLQVTYDEIGSRLLALRDHARKAGVQFIWYSPIPACIFNTVAHGFGNRGCAAADGLLHVSPSGDVLPCSSFRHDESLGNLLEEPFEPIWQSSAARFYRQKKMMPEVCHGCAHRSFCQGACFLYWREIGTAGCPLTAA